MGYFGIGAHFLTVLLSVCYSYPGPDNQVVTFGSEVNFTCALMDYSDPFFLRWYFYGLNDSYTCYLGRSYRPSGCTYLPNVTGQIFPDGNASLTLRDVSYTSAGTIVCFDEDYYNVHEAVLGVIENSPPTITSTASTSCIMEGLYIDLRCRTYYNGSRWMPLKLKWSSADGQLVSSETVNSSSVFESRITVQATRWTSFPYKCTVSFRAPTRYAIRSYYFYDATAPSYTSSKSTVKYDIVSCPTAIQFLTGNGQVITSGVTLTVGDEITCSTSSRYSVYTWINLNNINDIYRGPTINVKVTGDFSYMCSVSVSCGATTKDCSLAANITGTVLSSTTKTTISASTVSPSVPITGDSESSRHDSYNNSGAVTGLAVVLALALAAVIILLLWIFRHKIFHCHRKASTERRDPEPNNYTNVSVLQLGHPTQEEESADTAVYQGLDVTSLETPTVDIYEKLEKQRRPPVKPRSKPSTDNLA